MRRAAHAVSSSSRRSARACTDAIYGRRSLVVGSARRKSVRSPPGRKFYAGGEKKYILLFPLFCGKRVPISRFPDPGAGFFLVSAPGKAPRFIRPNPQGGLEKPPPPRRGEACPFAFGFPSGLPGVLGRRIF